MKICGLDDSLYSCLGKLCVALSFEFLSAYGKESVFILV